MGAAFRAGDAPAARSGWLGGSFAEPRATTTERHSGGTATALAAGGRASSLPPPVNELVRGAERPPPRALSTPLLPGWGASPAPLPPAPRQGPGPGASARASFVPWSDPRGEEIAPEIDRIGEVQVPSVDDSNFRYILLLMIFAWDERNAAHIGKHGVIPREAEFIIRHARTPSRKAPGTESSEHGGRRKKDDICR